MCVIGNPEPFEGVLRSLEAQSIQSLGALDDLEKSLQQDTKKHAIVVYANPVMVLGDKLQAGGGMTEATANWRDSTERLLSLFRRDRRRITLIDGHAAQRAPELLERLLGDRLSRQLDLAGKPQTDDEPAGLPQLVAAQALHQDEVAAALVSELEASSLPLGPAYRIDVDALIADGLSHATKGAVETMREENDLLMLQLHQVQEELEIQCSKNRRLQEEQREIRAGAKKAALVRDGVQAEFNEAREAWGADRKALADELEWNASTLTALRRSLSWRLTAPVRRVLGLFMGDSKL
ncbi:MAG: hypothetical protein AAGA95_04330 [Pseudomonadota bacterium]